MFRQIGPETVILEAGDAAAGLTRAAEHRDLDLIVLDLVLPGMEGRQAVAEFRHARPDVPVIVLSSSEDPLDARKALAQGALGYVPKSASPHTLLSAIRLVLNGDRYLPSLLLNEAPVEKMLRVRIDGGAAHEVLTERQVDVLRRLSIGRSNRQIAVELDIAEKTVKAHVTAIFRALNVINRTQAAAVGRDVGLI